MVIINQYLFVAYFYIHLFTICHAYINAVNPWATHSMSYKEAKRDMEDFATYMLFGDTLACRSLPQITLCIVYIVQKTLC